MVIHDADPPETPHPPRRMVMHEADPRETPTHYATWCKRASIERIA